MSLINKYRRQKKFLVDTASAKFLYAFVRPRWGRIFVAAFVFYKNATPAGSYKAKLFKYLREFK